MKLTDVASGTVIDLPNALLWSDEFDWSPVVSETTYSLTGAMIVEAMEKQAGRLITMVAPDDSMAWVPRASVDILRQWLTPAGRSLQLKLEYPTDTRVFDVMFRHSDNPIEAKPVTGFSDHNSAEWYSITLRLLEI